MSVTAEVATLFLDELTKRNAIPPTLLTRADEVIE